jgi:hypothetical protein
MTVAPQGLSPKGLHPQGFAAPGMRSQPGSFSPAFPALIGAEQFMGIPQAQAYQPSTWPQPVYASQAPCGMPIPCGQSPWKPAPAGYGAPA